MNNQRIIAQFEEINKMRLTKRQLKRIIREEYSRLKRRGLIRESLDKMYGEENLETWMGAYSGRIPDDDPRPVENIAQKAYDAGVSGKPLPQEIEDTKYIYPDDYEQAMEAYKDGQMDAKGL